MADIAKIVNKAKKGAARKVRQQKQKEWWDQRKTKPLSHRYLGFLWDAGHPLGGINDLHDEDSNIHVLKMSMMDEIHRRGETSVVGYIFDKATGEVVFEHNTEE